MNDRGSDFLNYVEDGGYNLSQTTGPYTDINDLFSHYRDSEPSSYEYERDNVVQPWKDAGVQITEQLTDDRYSVTITYVGTEEQLNDVISYSPQQLHNYFDITEVSSDLE